MSGNLYTTSISVSRQSQSWTQSFREELQIMHQRLTAVVIVNDSTTKNFCGNSVPIPWYINQHFNSQPEPACGISCASATEMLKLFFSQNRVKYFMCFHSKLYFKHTQNYLQNYKSPSI